MAAIALDKTWQRAAEGLDETSLRALLAGEVPAVRMEGFASADECRAFLAAIEEGAAASRAAETSRMTLIGVNFSNYAGQTKEGYFEQVEPSYRAVGAITARAGFDPLQRMIERLRAIWPAGRRRGRARARPLLRGRHQDPHDQRQSALRLRAAHSTRLRDRPHRRPARLEPLSRHAARDRGDDHLSPRHPARGRQGRQRRARALNLDRSYVEGVESFTFQPRIGEVVIINTRHPHDIIVENAAPDEIRAQTSSFIGRLPNDDLILWSVSAFARDP